MPVIDRSLSDCRYSAAFTVEGGDETAVSFALLDDDDQPAALPQGLALDQQQGVVRGVPAGIQFCIQNDEFCIKNDAFCIQNDEFRKDNSVWSPSPCQPQRPVARRHDSISRCVWSKAVWVQARYHLPSVADRTESHSTTEASDPSSSGRRKARYHRGYHCKKPREAAGTSQAAHPKPAGASFHGRILISY